MSIKFDDNLNQRISRTVKNYNRRIKTAKAAGIKASNLPSTVSVSQLKRSYSRRADLERELNNLQAFSRRKTIQDPLQKVSEYQKEVIRTNRRKTVAFLEKRKQYLEKENPFKLPSQQAEIEGVQRNIDLLRKPFKSATQSELKAMERQVNKYRQSFAKQAAGYRGFLTEIDWVMRNTGIPKEQRDEFFNKLRKLDAVEFEEVYNNSQLLQRVFELADSPSYGEMKLNTTEDNAREIVELLFDDIDRLIKNVKS